MTSDIQIQKGRHLTHNKVYYKSIKLREYREDKDIGESVNEDQGKRGGDGRTEEVNIELRMIRTHLTYLMNYWK